MELTAHRFKRILFIAIVSALNLAALISGTLTPSPAQAAPGINSQINFQGKLVNTNGTNITDNTYNVEFKIYQDGPGNVAGDTGGTLKWTEDRLVGGTGGVATSNGIFQVNLGSVTSLASVDFNQSVIWLSIQLGNTSSCTITTTFQSNCGGDGEMLPMIRFTAAPYAMNSNLLGGLSSANFVQLAQGVQTDGTTNSSIFIKKTSTGNFFELQNSSAVDVFSINNTGDAVFGNNADHTISVTAPGSAGVGKNLTVSAGTSNGANAGGTLALQGGAGGTGGAGGSVTINPGAPNGAGAFGTVSIGNNNQASQISFKVTAGANSTTVTFTAPSATNSINFPDAGGTICTTAASTCGGTTGAYVALQSSTPGSQQTGNINISGTTISAVAVQTALLDTPSGTTTLNVGTTNASTAINLNQATVIAANKNVSLVAGSGTFTQNYNAATGDALSVLATSATLSTARLAVIDHTATYVTTVTDSGNLLRVNRSLTTNTGGALTLSGALATLSSNCTQTAGTCTDSSQILSLTQSNASSSGDVLNISGAGTGALLRITDSTATAKDVLTIANGGTTTFKTQTDATGSFQVQNTAGNVVLSVDTSATAANNQVLFGKASTIDGKLLFNQSASANNVILKAPTAAIGSSYTLILPATAPALSQCLANDGTTIGQLTFTACGSGASSLQTAYNTSAGAAPSILTTIANKAVTIQTATTSGITAGNELFGVRDSHASDTIGNSLFTVNSTGVGINISGTGNPATTGDLTFGQGANRTINLIQATSGVGNNLSVIAGQGATGSTGGNLILQAGANGTGAGIPGTVLVKANGGNSTAAFQIQQSGGTEILTADTTNSQVIVRGINSDATVGASEQIASQDFTSANWTTCNGGAGGWSGTTTTATHNTGNTVVCATAAGNFSATSGVTYQLTFTIASNTTSTNTVTPQIAGSFGPPLGANATHTLVMTASGSGVLSFNPTTNFNGVISAVSIKIITTTNSIFTVNNSSNVTTLEVRSSSNTNNTFVGLQAGLSNTSSGIDNTGVGTKSLYSNTTGTNNTGLGLLTLNLNTTGTDNTALGSQALQNNTNAINSTAVGSQSLKSNTTGSNNSAFGYQSLNANTTGANNTAIGLQTLLTNASGSFNTALGHGALVFSTSDNNTGVGARAGRSITTGGNNTFLGYFAGYQDPNVSTFVTTNTTNSTAIGYGSQVQGSNALILGGQGANAVNVGIGTTNPTNTLSVSPDVYDTGTVCQGATSACNTSGNGLFGTGTTFTATMVGDEVVFADGTKHNITAFTSTTQVTIDGSATTHASTAYRIHSPALQVTSAGNVGIGTTSPLGKLHVVETNPSSVAALVVDNPSNDSVASVRLRDSLNTRYRSDWNLNGVNGLAFNAFDDTGSVYLPIEFDASKTVIMQGNAGIADATPAYLLTVGNNDVGGIDSSGNLLIKTFGAAATGDLSFGQGSTRTINILQATTANAVGAGLTLTAGQANGSTTGNVGGALALNGGAAAGSGNNAGGNVTIDGGAATGSGAKGSAVIQGAGGSVGIGTTTPDSTLHLVGGECIETTDTACAAGSGQLVINSTGANGLLRITDTTATARDVLTVADGGATTFRNQTDSATAVQIQNAGATETIFTADNTARGAGGGNRIKIGNSTGTDTATTILQLDAATANPTSNLAALNGGLFYNSTTNKVSIIENGVVKALCNTTDAGCGAGGSTSLQTAYNISTDPEISLGSASTAGISILDNATPIAGNLFEIQNSARSATYLGVTTSAFTLQNSSGKTGLVFDMSTKHLKVYEVATTPTNYADIYYDNASSTAIFAASSGTTQIGTGAGGGGNINLLLTGASDQLVANKTNTPGAAYSLTDFSFTRQLTGAGNALTGNVFKIEDLSTFTAGGSSTPNVLYVNQNSSNTGNLILAQTGGGTNDKFKVDSSGNVTIAASQSYTGAGAVTLSSAAASALTVDSGTTGALNVGTGANAKTITVGNTTGATGLVFNTGTAGTIFNAGAGATIKAVATAAQTTDLVKIDAYNGSNSVSTTGLAGLHIIAPITTGAITNSGILVDGPATPNASGTDTAINVTTGWDIGLNLSSGGMQLSDMTEPAAPAASTLRVYAQKTSGKMFLWMKGPSGVATGLQSSLWGNNVTAINVTTAATAPNTFGTSATTTGTASTPAVTEQYGYMKNLVSAVTTVAHTIYNTDVQFDRNSGNCNSSSNGGACGFFAQVRGAFPDTTAVYQNGTGVCAGAATTGVRMFIGLTDQTGSVPTAGITTAGDNPAGNRAGFARNYTCIAGGETDADWFFTTKDNTTENRVDTTMAFAGAKVWDYYVYAPPNSATTIYWRIDNLTDGTTVSCGVGAGPACPTANLPASGTFMRLGMWMNNINAVSRNLRYQRIYAESDR